MSGDELRASASDEIGKTVGAIWREFTNTSTQSTERHAVGA
jgi:hypothetical protein